MPLDILIRNGWVADGTGNPLIPADVGIEGDRIAFVDRRRGRDRAGLRAVRTLDAAGKIVCPGFVDCHSHSDRTILRNPTAQSTIRQGITTEIVGNCGNSPAPLDPAGETAHVDPLGLDDVEPPSWSTFASYLAVVEETTITPNMAWLVGHNTLRRAAGVSPRAWSSILAGARRPKRSRPWPTSSASTMASTPVTSATGPNSSRPLSRSS